jgi:hypothetical protein
MALLSAVYQIKSILGYYNEWFNRREDVEAEGVVAEGLPHQGVEDKRNMSL